jgi:hypothetical protein
VTTPSSPEVPLRLLPMVVHRDTTTEDLGFLHAYIQIYFYNTQMKQLEHIPKIDETFGKYTCNIVAASYSACNIQIYFCNTQIK